MKHEEHEYRGVKVHLVRMADYLGWATNLNGQDLGTWVRVGIPSQITIDDLNDFYESKGTPRKESQSEEEIVREHFNVLLQNAKETIDGLLK